MKIEILNEFINKVYRNKLKFVLYVLVVIILGIAFNFSNTIAVMLFKETNEQLLYKVEDVPHIGGNMTYGYEGLKFNEFKMKNNVDIAFWSYVDSEQDNIDRKVTIYFKSDKKIYACDTILTRRIDIYKSNRKYVKGDSEKYGFTLNFSPLTMKDGEYQLGIYTEENNQEKAFVWTPYTYIKEGNSFLEIEHNKQIDIKESDILRPSKDINVKVNTVSNTKYKDYLYIDGYAFKEYNDVQYNDIFVELRTSIGRRIIIEAVKMNANNIGGTYDHKLNVLPPEYDSEEYLNSGFAAKIPLIMLNEDTYEVNIIMRTGGQLYREESEEKYIHRVNVNSKVDDVEIANSNDVNYYIENLNVAANTVNLSGWIFENNLNSTKQQVYIHFENEQGSIQTFKAGSTLREDIAKWKGDTYLYSGFTLSIPTDYLVEGKYTVSASVKNGDRLDTAAKPFIEEEKVYINRINVGQQVAGLSSSKNDKVQYYIETLEIKGDMISVAGWIFKEGTPSANHNIYIKFEDQNAKTVFYKAVINERIDIARWRGDEYLYSGFYVNIPSATLAGGEYKVTAVIETDRAEEAVKPYIKEIKKIQKK